MCLPSRGSTQVDSILAFKYKTGLEVTEKNALAYHNTLLITTVKSFMAKVTDQIDFFGKSRFKKSHHSNVVQPITLQNSHNPD